MGDLKELLFARTLAVYNELRERQGEAQAAIFHNRECRDALKRFNALYSLVVDAKLEAEYQAWKETALAILPDVRTTNFEEITETPEALASFLEKLEERVIDYETIDRLLLAEATDCHKRAIEIEQKLGSGAIEDWEEEERLVQDRQIKATIFHLVQEYRIELKVLKNKINILEKTGILWDRETTRRLGRMVKAYREKHKISASELGRKSETGTETILSLETGRWALEWIYVPSLSCIERLCNAVEIQVQDLGK